MDVCVYVWTCVCVSVHEEQFTTQSVENLVEIVKNFNDTTGFIFSTALLLLKQAKAMSEGEEEKQTKS